MHRGFVYNKMEEASDDNKEKFLRLAISDYEIAHKLGVDISSYYNDMGVTYSNLEEYHKAISYFTKAIKKNPNDASVYTNRGHTYHNIKEYQKALNDFEKALDIDADYYAAYLARSYTYESLRRKETDLNKRINYIQLQIADLECVIKINPEDNESKNEKKHLEQFLKREISKENEKRGDLQSKKKEYTEAFKLYIDAILPYEKQYPLNQNSNKEFDVKFDIIRIISKLYDISSNDINFQKIEMKVAVAKFCQCMQAFAPFLYENGEKDTAEKLLILLLDHNNADIGKNAALNLAFMKRRCETRYTEKSAIELLELYPNQKSTVWCMNKALCYIDGIGVDVDWHRAIEILDNSDTDVLEALNWWEKINMVGEKENNIALLLFALSKKYHIKDDPVSFEERINKAKQDGYKIPDDLDF